MTLFKQSHDDMLRVGAELQSHADDSDTHAKSIATTAESLATSGLQGPVGMALARKAAEIHEISMRKSQILREKGQGCADFANSGLDSANSGASYLNGISVGV
ncbi:MULTISPECIES: hypothetical protein [Mycolicibacterium]|uniref:hypothetical protein n=1 Tax=Mycolicibacterium TaxID=1866885 RepID=UPI002607D79B|nr:hypothetical protein [Mycolicibacterium fortuitum]